MAAGGLEFRERIRRASAGQMATATTVGGHQDPENSRTCCPFPTAGIPVPLDIIRSQKSGKGFPILPGLPQPFEILLQGEADPPVIAAGGRDPCHCFDNGVKGAMKRAPSPDGRVVPITHQRGGGGFSCQNRDLPPCSPPGSTGDSAQWHRDRSRPNGTIKISTNPGGCKHQDAANYGPGAGQVTGAGHLVEVAGSNSPPAGP